jgi:GntR family transcriptional regulator, transcriptional repressor for pyruvate dehydrogenase complex
MSPGFGRTIHPIHMFTRVRVGRVSEEVVKQVQEAIFSGELKPGNRLPPERELAEQFGLSRMSVRDALRMLESSGLVEIKVGSSGGTFIREPDFDPLRESLSSVLCSKKAHILDLVETRKIVETAIVELAAERATGEDLRAMREAIDRARTALEAGDLNYGPHSVKFHAALTQAAKNHVLTVTARSFRAFFSDVLEKLLPTEDMARRAVADHWELYKAIENQDGQKARQLMSDHLSYFETKVKALGDKLFAKGE